MELDAVSIVVPEEWLSYSLLGKLGGDTVKNLTLNKDIIEKPNKIPTQLQDLAHLNHIDKRPQTTSPTALFSNVEEPHKTFYYCSKGKHNIKCTTHKIEDFLLENPHLRPLRREKKHKNSYYTAHLTISKALMTIQELLQPTEDQLRLDCGATHHMFNSLK
ncbi:hypothetical protein O181_102082 [Austropuccinia psidii MF-1]|uniref:Uncharacterized protein n=1 Tax=Austropuccinia psidii MF-1 TaxID=1389203 RepID=A0A9Q3JII3_9BASI|nr:hypothetical protein [Austropuccinia psidii MF-1]